MDPGRGTAGSSPAEDCLAGEGEMATLMRGFDWGATPLGPAAGWPATLKAAVRILLRSRHAVWLGWGPQLTFLYNDAYRATTLGDRHPGALGRPAIEVWPEIVRDIGPRIDAVMSTDSAGWDEALLRLLERSGYRAQPHRALSYSTLTDDNGQIAGLLCAVTQDVEYALPAQELARLQREAAEREQALTASSEEAEGMMRLHDFSTRLLAINGLRPLLEEVLDATMALHGADFGMVQRFDPATGDLLLVAQRNLPEAVLARFERVNDESTVCGRAVRRRERVIVEDLTTDPGFAPHLALAVESGFLGVQSTPLISRSGEMLGAITTYFRQPHRFGGTVLRFTDLYARQAADIVERNRTEEALRASEERFRRYFELGLIGMALTSPSTACIEANDELCRILGYSRDELLHMSWPELTHPDDLAADQAEFDRVVAGEQDGYLLDKRFIRKDGSTVSCTMAAKCLRTADGSVDCFVALVQDITERIGAEDALRRAHDQLAHVARVVAMGELVASIAHEMNQPLAAIVANAHATSRWLAVQPANLGEAVAAVGRIVADGHRASQVIARIRGFVRRSEARREAFDMHELLCDVASMLEREARTRNVKLQVEDRAGEPSLVVGDRVQLQQVVLNLVLNGFDAMATVPDAQRCLRLRVERDGPQAIRVSVRDAGVGLDPRERDRIFDAFYTSKPAGMGMGLAISRSIVEAHEGRLWSTPNEESGETFSFTLAV
jgi:PAS domain S-box-containing protein